ncbi:MAG: hypothetical protein K2X82_07390, partial [Gemmataceae bacterium]|nr:hypothetical protein [Gemmataceae bacterium]
MSATVVCPGCGRRVRMESGVALRRAKCSKCRARLYRPRADRLRGRLGPDTAADPYTVSDAPIPAPVPPPAPPAEAVVPSVPRRRRGPAAAGVACAAIALMLFGALAYRAGVRDASPPPVEPVAEAPAAPPPPATEPRPPAPPSHLDLVYRTGRSRLDDGPADVTALARAPTEEVVVGYADGSTRIWPLDQPAFDAPRPGPTADGPVRRITLDPAGRVAYLATPRGL